MPMNPEIKAQWTAALRGGEYEQGHGYLNADGKLCCLGVLCELAVRAEVIESHQDEYDRVVYNDETDTILPTSVRIWAGLPDGNVHDNANNPEVVVNNMAISLAELNDGEGSAERGYTFGEIADLIDQQL